MIIRSSGSLHGRVFNNNPVKTVVAKSKKWLMSPAAGDLVVKLLRVSFWIKFPWIGRISLGMQFSYAD